ncbi:MAG: sigma-70 factor domain-containing protein, partial [Anaerolineales bacterium]
FNDESSEAEDDELGEEEEPNGEALSKEEKEVEDLVKEEPLDILDDPGMIMELGEDPVRLYLKEIGGIALLDTDQEFWLATCMEAARRVDSLARQHPLARRGVSTVNSIYRALYDELTTAWKRLVEDTERLGFELPDLALVLSEARMLRVTWDPVSPSYLRAYLDNGLWGEDPLWDGVARNAFTVFICLYSLPDEVVEKLQKYIGRRHVSPPASTFAKYLPEDDVLQKELNLIRQRAEEAQEAIYKMAFIALHSRVAGYLDGGLDAWMEAGNHAECVPQMDVHDLHHKLSVNGLQIL